VKGLKEDLAVNGEKKRLMVLNGSVHRIFDFVVVVAVSCNTRDVEEVPFWFVLCGKF